MQERSSGLGVSEVHVPAADDCAFEAEVPEHVGVAAVAAASTASRVVAPIRDGISLEAVRNSMSGIDGDDLDVPAFMRKRADN